MTLSLVYGSSAVFMALLLRSPPWGSDSAAPCEGRWRQGGSHPWCGPETHLPPPRGQAWDSLCWGRVSPQSHTPRPERLGQLPGADVPRVRS